MMVDSAALVLFLAITAGQEPAAGRAKPSEVRWRQLSVPQRQRLEQVYRSAKEHAPDADWASYRRLREERGRSGHFEQFPSHWRDFLVRNARWAQEQVKKLPAAQQDRLKELPLDKRTDALKKILRPHFLTYLKECRQAAQEVFSPLELRLLKQLPPRERALVLRRSRRDAFGLISPWSSQKYQSLGKRKRLVTEYLLLPEALTSLGRSTAPRAGDKQRENAPDAPRRPAEQKQEASATPPERRTRAPATGKESGF